MLHYRRVAQVEGRGQADALLAALSSGLQQFGVNVNSAAQQSEDGKVLNVFKVTTKEGGKVPKVCAWIPSGACSVQPARCAAAALCTTAVVCCNFGF